VLLLGKRGWQLWDCRQADPIGVAMPGDAIEWTAVNPAGDRLVTYHGGSLYGWALPECRPLFQRKDSPAEWRSPRRRLGPDRSWSPPRCPLPGAGGHNFALSPDKRWLAIHDDDLHVWELAPATLRHTLSAPTLPGLSFSADSRTLTVTGSQTQQSGNQDWNTVDSYDVTTGACVSSHGYWDSEGPATPARELAPGVLLHDQQLQLGAARLALPYQTIVARGPDGTIHVACTHRGRVELHALRLPPSAPATPAA